MAVQAESFADTVAQTLNDLGENKFTDLMSDYQDTVALKQLIPQNKIQKKAGAEIEFRVQTDHNNSARHVGLGYTVNIDIPSLMTTGKVPWRHTNWHWAWERRLVAMNRAPRKIIDFIKSQRIGGLASAILKFEEALWRAPAVTDDLSPYGIPYYVVKSNTPVTSNDGFNGLVPSGHTTVAEIDPSTQTRWRNYATQYSAVSFDDLVRKMRRAFRYTDFKPLVKETPEYDLGNKRGIYTNYPVLGPLEELLRTQNENLGNDLAAKDDAVMFRRADVEWVKELDKDTTNPVYGINWSVLCPIALQGEWMKEETFDKLPSQPTVGYTNTDCSWNLICYNRRKNWVLATDTTMPA